jgi:transcriptional regulator with XRE-family HTH domain
MPLRRLPRPIRLRPRLGIFLAEARFRRGLTQGELARELGVPQTFICRVETGVKAAPPARLPAWAVALGIDLADLDAVR